MKLLGARFRDFACFDECFVPLNEGVQLLVGKNNAGKTALLRGLTALSALPVPGAPSADANLSMDRNLSDYCRRDSSGGEAAFNIDILFAVNAGDSKIVDKVLGLPQVRNSASYVLEYSFRALCQNPRLGFEAAHLLHDSQKLPLIQSGQELLYNANAQVAGRQPVPAEFFSCLANLRSVRIVDAHRVVKPQGLQQQNFLSTGAETLAPFLDNLRGDDRDTFDQIEKFVVSVFPEFRYVNTRKQQGTTALVTLTRADSEQQILLSHCGTGVEQILALATFIFTSPPGTLMLLDEPHSYLHPIAERELIRLILKNEKHRYVISTHSAILMNAVTPDRILSLNSNKVTREVTSKPPDVAHILHSLGYQNSDLLFSDRLVFVEGETEQRVLPRFLAFGIDSPEIVRTGFPDMGGSGRLNGRTRQTSLLHFEKLLRQLGRVDIPRIYLFDGDCNDEDRALLNNTPILQEARSASIAFLPRTEIENYLLVPDAIADAIRELSRVDGEQRQSNSKEIEDQIKGMLASDDKKLFPNGKTGDPLKTVKGSELLDQIFDRYALRYQKVKTGTLIASKITPENELALNEIRDLLSGVLPRTYTMRVGRK